MGQFSLSGNPADLRIGIIGGTGREGSGLALRLAQAGFNVAIGSRSAERALETARTLASELRAAGWSASVSGLANSELPGASDVLFLTVPFQAAVETVRELNLPAGSILVDTTVPVVFESGRMRFVETPETSCSESIAAALHPGVHLVAAFKTIPAHMLSELDTDFDCDLFICTDSEEARTVVANVAASLRGLRPVNAGKLANARTIERMSALAIEINRRYKTKHSRFRVVGLPG